ncbi:MAG: hypothetical protein ACRD8O_15545 [Bryobacteraceae bacterium]
MRKFQFELSRILDWRRRQLEVEETKLAPLLAEQRAIETERAATEREETEANVAIATVHSTTGEELAAFDAYRLYLKDVRKRIESRLANCANSIEKQRQAIVTARRQVRLLERLKERRRNEWQAAADREQENLAAELYLARWRQP